MLLHYVSGLREESSELCVNEILDFSLKLAGKFMNRRRIEILRIVSANGGKTITSVVDEVSEVLSCPKSTVWSNVNLLKELGLIKNNRGGPVKITKIGRIILSDNRKEEVNE
ncbi:MAG: hypothetical protein JSV39_01990 [Candidatus Aenigmatarchaeota archaeon]|nr:MAG: hypothetical protein JSV39_01990 [Candidatus Aenigmarchaeota archaeon]